MRKNTIQIFCSIIIGISLTLLLGCGIFLALRREQVANVFINLAYWGLIISAVIKIIEVKRGRD